MARPLGGRRRAETVALPDWINPQLTRLVDQAPEGPDWLHEIKFDGYRMHAWLDRGAVRLLTRTGLDWTHKYPAVAAAVALLPARQTYLDGELCGVRPDGTTLVQPDPERFGHGQQRRSRLFPVRSPPPRW
jgi:bifunctional non-homologous end joining protein LigD